MQGGLLSIIKASTIELVAYMNDARLMRLK